MIVKTVYVEITNKCNLNCATCYNRSGLNINKKEITFDQIENILKVFLPFGMQRFLISGGEPTLHSDFDRILSLIDQYPEVTFGIVTNGTVHNEKLLNYLNTRTNLKLQISLDGSSEKVNSATRGQGTFDKTIDFAKKIKTPHITPLMKMVVSQNNLDDVENYCNLAVSLGFTPELAFIYKSGNGSDEWETKGLTSLQKLKVLKFVENFNKENKTDVFLPRCTVSCPFLGKLDELSFCIKTDGSIQPCQSLYDAKYTIGNIFNFNVSKFVNNLNLIVDIAKKRSKMDYGCQKCMINNICGRGCMAEAVNLCGDPLANDNNCEYRKQQFINLNLKNVINILKNKEVEKSE